MELRAVDQTKFGTDGNCMSACFASILGVPIEEVPDPAELHKSGKNWLRVLNQWLAKFDLAYMEVRVDAIDYFFPQGYHLIGGQSHRGTEGGHSVVGFAGKMVHDPHPDKSGLTKVEDYGFLVALSTRASLQTTPQDNRLVEFEDAVLATAIGEHSGDFGRDIWCRHCESESRNTGLVHRPTCIVQNILDRRATPTEGKGGTE